MTSNHFNAEKSGKKKGVERREGNREGEGEGRGFSWPTQFLSLHVHIVTFEVFVATERLLLFKFSQMLQ